MNRLTCLCLLLVGQLAGTAGLRAQEVSVNAPAEAQAGSQISVSYSGSNNPRDFITIVKPDAAEGHYGAYQYTQESPLELQAPPDAGEYEIRYLGADSPYPTLWRQKLVLTKPDASLEGPATVAAGSEVEIAWTGPDNPQDFITIVSAGTAEGEYDAYQYTQGGSPVTLTAPDVAGEYEVRYLMGQSPYRTLASIPLKVTATEASITAPAEAPAGSLVRFEWQGPDNPRDFITVVPADAPEKEYDRYVYTQAGSPAELLVPDTPGDYELRYLTGQSYALLARAPIRTTAVTASVQGPQTIEALSAVLVKWEGPGNPQDYVIIQPVVAEVSAGGQYAYVSRGDELRITAPSEPGDYEYRYVTGQSNHILARQAVTVTPRNAPGKLKVVDGSGVAGAASGAAGTGAGAGVVASVVVILDASGSMLQRLDGERRIDIAKASLAQLVKQDLPDNTRFGLRVFGHKEADSCRTDLEIPLAPLNRSEAAAKVSGINAMNLAKTPIAATLAKAGEDLAGQSGPKLIILVTDGEETCDGDPAAVITSLREGGLDVRVNIVGFAIDELMLRENFAKWAELGGGQYIDARNAAELSAGLASAIERPFEVFAADGGKVASGLVNGLALELPPGDYSVKIAGSNAQDVTVKADEESVISLDE